MITKSEQFSLQHIDSKLYITEEVSKVLKIYTYSDVNVSFYLVNIFFIVLLLFLLTLLICFLSIEIPSLFVKRHLLLIFMIWK